MAAALPKVVSYTKNIAKSVQFSAVDYLKGTAPNAAEFLEDNEELFKQTFSAIKDYRNTVKTVNKLTRNSRFGVAASEGTKALFEDLKTGKFYNRERVADFEIRAMGSDGFDGFDDDWGSMDADLGFSEDSNEEYAGARATIRSTKLLSEKVGAAVDESIKANAQVTYKSAAHITDSISKATNLFYAQNVKFHSMVNTSMANLQASTATIAQTSTAVQTHIENAKTYYEKSLAIFQENNAILKEMAEMQRNLYKREQEVSKRSGYNDVVGAGGTPDLEEYGKRLLKNVKSQLPAEFSMLFGDDFGKDANMLLAFVGSPLKFLPDLLVKTIVPATIKKTAEAFDKTLGGIFPTLMAKAAKAGNDSDNPFIEMLGKIFGLDIKSKSSVNTANYNKGAVPFDGMTRKSIIEVIPGHLARIESALTGDKERIYDYENGKWTDIRDIKKARDYRVKNAKISPMSDFTHLNEFINTAVEANKEAGEALRKSVEDMFEKIYDDYGSFSLRRRDKEDDGEGTEAWEYYGFESKEDFDKVLAEMKKDRASMMELAGNMIDSRERLARYYEEAENSMNSITHLYNNSYKISSIDTDTPENRLKFGNVLTNATDEYNKNIFFYLRGMYAELRALRYGSGFFRGGGTSTGTGIIPRDPNPIGTLENELQASIDRERAALDYYSTSNTGSDDNKPKDLDEIYEEFSLENQLREADRKEREKKNKNKDDRPFTERFLNSNSIKDKFAVIKSGVDNVLRKPATVVEAVIQRADQRIFDLLFGKEDQEIRDREGRTLRGTMDYIVVRLQETFDELNDWLHEHILDPFMEWFKKTPAYEYMVKAKDWVKEKARPVADAIKRKFGYAGGVFKNAMANTYGRLFTGGVAETVPVGYDPNDEEDYLRYMANGGDDVLMSARGRFVTKRGLTMISPGEMIIPATMDKNIQNKQLREEIRMKNKFFPGLKTDFNARGTVNARRGTNNAIADEDIDKVKQVTKKVIQEVTPNAPDFIADALIGGGVSLVTGLIGGPLLGIAAGAGVGIARNSSLVQQKLFGDKIVTDEDGTTYREGGIVPPEMQKAFKKYFPDMRDFGIAGGVAGLFTPMGIVPGLMVGATVGFLKNNEAFQDFLFGEKDKDGERDGGLISKAFRDKVKKVAPRLAVGALGGVLLGPFGLLGNAVLGTALGFTSTTETFHRIVFGRKGDDGKRHGGLVGQLKNFIGSIIGFGKKHILEPLKDFISPFTQMVKNAIFGVADGVKDFLNSMFEKTIGRPLEDFIQHKVIGGMTKWLKRLLFLPVTLTKGAIAAPLHMLGFIGNNIRDNQIRKGTARDMTAKQRVEWRDKHLNRGLINPRFDRFDKLDNMLVNDFNGKGGTAKMQEFRDLLALYIEAEHELGKDGAKIVKRVGDNISQFFNTEGYRHDPSKSLYSVLGYKAITSLHKLVKKGDLEGIDKWLDKRLDYMSIDQKHALMDKIRDDVLKIAEIREKQKKDKKTRKGGRALLARATNGSLTNKKSLKRYLAAIDKELGLRGGKDVDTDAPPSNVVEQMTADGQVIQRTITTKSDIIIDLLRRITGKVEENDGETRTIDDNDTNVSDAVNRIASGETNMADETQNGDLDEVSRNKKKNKLSRLLTRLKNKKEKKNQSGTQSTTASDNGDDSTEASANNGENNNDGDVQSTGGIITGNKRSIMDKIKHGFHMITTPDGNAGLADSNGKLLPGKSSVKILRERAKEKVKELRQAENFKEFKLALFGKRGLRGAMKGARDGVFGLIGSMVNSQSIISKIFKGLLFGGTAIAALGHGAGLLKQAMPSIKKFLSPITDAIKSIGHRVAEALGKAFPFLFGEDGIVPKAITTVSDTVKTIITSPGKIVEGIFDWYKDGFIKFKAYILNPLWSWAKPKIGALVFNAINGGYKTLEAFLASVEDVTTTSKDYQAVDRQGNKLYKDAEGNITTEQYDQYGNENEAYTKSVMVTTTTYGDDGLAFSAARAAMFNPNGRNTDYKKEAVDLVTGYEYEMVLSSSGDNRGECTIVNRTTGDYIRFLKFDPKQNRYLEMCVGYYSDQTGVASATGSIIGSLVGAGIIVALAATSVITVPIALGAVALAAKAGAVAGGMAGARLYKANNGQYLTEISINYAASNLIEVLTYFGLTGFGAKDFDNWPVFATSTEYENAYNRGDKEAIELAKQDLGTLDLEKMTKDGKTIIDIKLPSDSTKIKFWGFGSLAWRDKGQEEPVAAYYEGAFANGVIKYSFPYFREFYNTKGELVYYDTRMSYWNLPLEIQSVVTGEWHPNTDPTKTSSYPTVSKAMAMSMDDGSTVKQVRNTSVPTYRTTTTRTSSWSKSAGIKTASKSALDQAQKKQEEQLKTGERDKTTDIWGNKDQGGEFLEDMRGPGHSRSGKGHIWQRAAGIGSKRFGNNTLSSDGCGPVTAANMINALSGHGSTLDATTSIARKYIDSTGGTTVDYFDDVFSRAGYSTHGTSNKNALAEYIKAGNPAVLLGNSGSNTSSDPFGNNDHYINVYGVDSNNNAIVEDPDLPQSRVKYPLKRVMKDTKYGTMIGRSRYGRFVSNLKRSAKARLSGKGSAAQEIWNFFKMQNWSDYTVSGILGNWEIESGLNPGNLENSYSSKLGMSDEQYTSYVNQHKAWPPGELNNSSYHVGYGLAQWTGGGNLTGRKNEFLNYMINFCEKHGKPFNIADLDGQLNFALREFNSANYSDFRKYTLNATSPEQAATYMLGTFEMPYALRNGSISESSDKWYNKKRRAAARKWYEQFKGTAGKYTGIIDSSVSSDGSAGGQVAEDNSLYGQISSLGRSILNRAYGSELVDFLFGSETASASSDGSSGSYSGTSDPNSSWTWPIHANTPSAITSRFGPRNVGTNPHRGLDISGAGIEGKEIIAVAPGEVVDVYDTPLGARGKLVQIKHQTSTGQDMYVTYQHNKKNLVSKGQTVKQGQSIALVGNTGAGTGPHLHFEVNPQKTFSISGGPTGKGYQVDPLGFISASRKYSGSGRSGHAAINKVYDKSKTKLNVKKTIIGADKLDNIDMEKLIKPGSNDVYIGADGNPYMAPIPGAQGRSGHASYDYATILNAIVNILATIANNTAALDQILTILASTGVKVDKSAVQKAAGSARDAKAQIRKIVEDSSRQAAHARSDKNNGYTDYGTLFNNESTAFIVQTMEAIATQ